MSVELITVLAMAAVFAVAMAVPVNMGAVAFAAAFLVGTLAVGMTADEILAGFPGSLFLILVGVTYLFAIAQTNGTVDLLIRWAVAAVRGRAALLPWVMFATASALTAIGALSPAAVAIVAPIAMGFAARYRIDALLMGAMVVHGAQAGSFSPVSVYGGIVAGILDDLPISMDPMAVFALTYAFNLAFAVVLYLVLGRRTGGAGVPAQRASAERVRQAEHAAVGAGAAPGAGGPASDDGVGGPGAADRPADGTPASDTGQGPARIGLPQVLTLLGLAVMVVLTVGFQLHLGAVAMGVAVVLALAFPRQQKEAVDKISWPIVLLLCGVLTYVSVLEEAGTIEWVGDAVVGLDAALLSALVLCVIAAAVTAVASSTAMLGMLIPLAAPFLMQGDVSTTAMIAALAISVTMTDISPFSTNGALVLANSRTGDAQRFSRRMLAYTGLMCVAAPLVSWAAIVVPGMF
ncbi:SLC13 family permease [Nocardiopsis sp. RSe5-2]|uniref:SLC13 family permease n=1 Tax=Nocardiopsis endophytica TaxID=3018445 RepID=A0ABT4U4Q1_9ACTN|nr:SLC13 family permease [Nocardiopsis endophytica]MDA2811922.1 SLC13 family permease [Nocardiopsis endophytica]